MASRQRSSTGQSKRLAGRLQGGALLYLVMLWLRIGCIGKRISIGPGGVSQLLNGGEEADLCRQRASKAVSIDPPAGPPQAHCHGHTQWMIRGDHRKPRAGHYRDCAYGQHHCPDYRRMAGWHHRGSTPGRLAEPGGITEASASMERHGISIPECGCWCSRHWQGRMRGQHEGGRQGYTKWRPPRGGCLTAARCRR